MKNDTLIVLGVAGALLMGLVFLTKLAAMGALLFLAAWIIITRVPGLRAITQRFPVTMDILMTIGIAWAAPGHGFQKMVAVSIAALMFTLWTATVRVRYLHARAGGGAGAPQGA